MSYFSVASIKHISSLIDQSNLKEDWSVGQDGTGGTSNPIAFLILEEIYLYLNTRLEISSIKYFKNISDPLAYDWHRDDSNLREKNISKVALAYLTGCEGSAIEFRSGTYYPKPYDLLLFNNDAEHRGLNNKHGPLLKYTFI
jgi:hypothetical protein